MDSTSLAELAAERGAPIHYLEETGSTNDDAKAGGRAGAPSGSVWIAESQTAGRGRQGRTWVSPRGDNLLFSVLYRVSCAPARVPVLSLVVGLAVRDAVADALAGEAAARVKWPNDVQIRGKKVAGILVESTVMGAKVENLVVGIGINVLTREFPSEIAEIATSVAREAHETGRDPSRLSILRAVLVNLDRDLELAAHRGLGPMQARLNAHDALAGRRVVGDGIEGTAEGIDPEGRLMIRRDDGVVQRIVSGEIRIRVAE